MEPISLNEKAARQAREQIQAAQAAAAQLEAFLYGLRAGMDVPDDWQFDARLMAWVAPSAPPPAPLPPATAPETEPTHVAD